MTWHQEDTDLLTEGAQVPGAPRPRQLSRLAQSSTQGDGQVSQGRRESDAGLERRGGECGPREPRAAAAARSQAGPGKGVAGWTRKTDAGAHLTPGLTEGVGQELDLGRLGPPWGLQSSPSPPWGGKQGGEKAEPASSPSPSPSRARRLRLLEGDERHLPERRNQFGRSRGAERKGRLQRKGARTRGGERRRSHW